MIPKKVNKLLRSSVTEDNILGVIWCANNLGKEWCMANFTYNREEDGYKKNPYPRTIGNIKKLKFKDFYVLLGNVCIEAFTDSDAYAMFPPETYDYED